MDHKSFFQDFGKFELRDVDSEYTLEQLYQAFKQRLIEELRTDLKSESCMACLTDTSQEPK